MGQNSAVGQPVVQRNESETIDMRPESFPYASPLVTLYFTDGPPLPVPIRLIEKSPKLFSCCGYDMTLHLAHIPNGPGHVLVNYLFTGVRVYAVAQDYGLPDLESLAKEGIEKLGNRLQAIRILDVLKDLLPNPSVKDILAESAGETLSFANALLKVVVELWCEKTYSPSPSLNNLAISQDRCDESAAAHVKAAPIVHFEHNPSNVLESTLDHEGSDTKCQEILKKKSKKEKRKMRKRAELSHNTTVEEQKHSREDRERVGDSKGDEIAPTAFTTIIPTSKPEASIAKDQQQSSATDYDEKSEPKPTPQPPFLFSSGFGLKMSLKNLLLQMRFTPFMGGIKRFQHICVQESYAKFLPEELRWKHELHSKVTGFKQSEIEGMALTCYFDHEEADRRIVQDGDDARDDGALLLEDTVIDELEVARILPHSLMKVDAGRELSPSKQVALGILNMFNSGAVRLIDGTNIDRPSNAITLTSFIYAAFGDFKVFFELILDQQPHTHQINTFYYRCLMRDLASPITRTLVSFGFSGPTTDFTFGRIRELELRCRSVQSRPREKVAMNTAIPQWSNWSD
ncbi:hypothetical protein NUW58_g5756 [Xylaria curta]|uniref:Uncharacterized protein n=1 Tax=Xylaria curta TaxID=42375 RepID=A0ACC1P2A5_9PEZI|nr:hypothetical protein NUW58_g5756 [Xylaria curta]